MTKPDKYVPKHRAPGAHKRKRDPWGTLRASARSSVALTGIAAMATAGVVGVGVLTGGEDETALTASGATTDVSAATAERLAERGETVSRSDRRQAKDPAKAAALSTAVGVVTAHSREVSLEDPRGIARALLPDFGFADSQFNCLDLLWIRESNWRWNADNPSSSAYGIPQALPGSKMSTAGADWESNPETQIKWGLGYIKNRYGNPCAAWDHSQRVGWY
ncbi:lytic transglycosylase domain-containing protein [Nocardioides gilvus]|uniref:aggregation-promoting factor C-terminal-like domain-containing protein n=1 Tax=Nocardioides gilvus TaxID=1735589 RepID=UPI00194E642C|nr:lytic transglycosylase domain-containing protein [Nocardioides gilvus]